MARRYSLLKIQTPEPVHEPVTEVNIIPVIDISLVLLVVLFVTAPLLSYPNLPIDLPKASASESQEPTIAITYSARGELAVGSQMTSWAELPAQLRAAVRRAPRAAVLLRVDKTVPYREVERLLAVAKEAGGEQIALGTVKSQ